MNSLLTSTTVREAIAVHAAWRTNLMQAISAGGCDLDRDRIAAPTQCTLGAILAGIPGDDGRHAAVKALHDAFHAAAAEIVTLVHQGQRDAAGAQLLGDFAAVSDELVRGLLALGKGT